MSHILVITSEMAGRINVSCELARRLGALGHRVTIASPAAIGERVAAQGLEWLPLGSATSLPSPDVRSEVGLGRVGGFVRRLRLTGEREARRDAKVDALDPEGTRREIMLLAPDLILTDIELSLHTMAAATSGIPLLTWTTMLSLWKRPGLPPLGSDVVVGRGWRGSRAGLEWEWMRFRSWKWLRNQRLRVTRFGEDQMSVLGAAADRLGFPFRQSVEPYQWLVPFVYGSLPLLVFNAFPLEFPHEPHPTVSYVGPVLNSDRRDTTRPGEAEISERLAEVYRRRNEGDSAALIYCSFGAWHKGDDGSFLRTIGDALRPRPEWDLVLGLGGRTDPSLLSGLPDNVHLFEWAPQLEVLERADLAIHHAGISSVNESIVTGTPMVLYPFDFLDQPGNAARVDFHGMGVVGDRDRDSAEDLRAHIASVLAEDRYRNAVSTMRSRFAEIMKNDPAVDAILAALR